MPLHPVRPNPASTEQLRRANSALVLRTLRRFGPASRAELAQRTGLAKATVGAIVAALEQDDAVEEGPDDAVRTGARGRPGRPVSLRRGVYVALGLELNVDYVAAVLVDLDGTEVVSENRAAGGPDGPDPQTELIDLACELTAYCTRGGVRLIGVTLALPALVRDDDRTVAWAPNLALDGTAPDGTGQEGRGLVARLGELAPRCPVRVSNDANCAALAELGHGAMVGVTDAVYLTGTVGIGAGLVIGETVLQGAAGFAGEVGHIPVGDPDAPCGCGRRGCWEAAVGLHALLDAVGMAELDTPTETARSVAVRAEADPAVRAVVERVGRDLGLGLAILAGVLDPDVVVLGGYFVPLGELILGPARTVLDQRLASPAQHRPELRLSPLDLRAAALGAAEQSLAAVLTGEADLPGR